MNKNKTQESNTSKKQLIIISIDWSRQFYHRQDVENILFIIPISAQLGSLVLFWHGWKKGFYRRKDVLDKWEKFARFAQSERSKQKLIGITIVQSSKRHQRVFEGEDLQSQVGRVAGDRTLGEKVRTVCNLVLR